MLPSGNDAAVVLAEHFGQYLFEVATRFQNNKAGATGNAGANKAYSGGPPQPGPGQAGVEAEN